MRWVEGQKHVVADVLPKEVYNHCLEIIGRHKKEGLDLKTWECHVRYDGVTMATNNPGVIELWFTFFRKGIEDTSFIKIYNLMSVGK